MRFPGYFFGGPATKTVKALVVANVGFYVLQVVFSLFHSNYLELHLGLVPASVTHNLMVWQFVTYMFLHGGVFHLFFNMLNLYMFGNELERYWGTSRFIRYYFLTGIGAGVFAWLVAINNPNPIVVVGASGAIFGLLIAYGLTYPDRIVYLNFLLPIKVKWLVVIMGCLSFISSQGGLVGFVAHIGGMVVGYFLLKGKSWVDRYRYFYNQRQRDQLKRQFEVYYGDVRRKVDQEKKKPPTIH
jgi:membrane associated rhomboid family serine protease